MSQRCDGAERACKRVMSSVETMTQPELARMIDGSAGYPFNEQELDQLIDRFNEISLKSAKEQD
jgi:hypothetical protein